MEDHKNITTEKQSDSSLGNGGHNSGVKTQGNEAGHGGASNREVNKPANGNGNVGEKVKDTAGSFAEMAKTTAGDAYEAVADKASSVIDDRKSDFSVGLIGVADTVRRVGGAIKDGDSKNGVTEYAATYSDTAAKKLEQAAEYFETSDLKSLARDVESYARRHPAIFLGAAFAVGLLAARFIKSSPPADASSAGAAPKNLKAASPNGSAVGASA